MKPTLSAMTAAVMTLSSMGVLAQSNSMMVSVNGERIGFGAVQPRRAGNSALVPLRPIMDRLGGRVRWERDTGTIWVSMKNNYFIRLFPGKNFAQVDGRNIPLSEAPQILRGQTLVPIQFFQQALGVDTIENTVTGDVAFQTEMRRGSNRVRLQRSPGWQRLEKLRRADVDRYNRDRIMANENYQWYLQQQDYQRYLNEREAWEPAYRNYMSSVPAPSQGMISGYVQGPSATPYVTFLYGLDVNQYLLNRALWQTSYQNYLNMLEQNNRAFPNQALVNEANWQNYLQAREALIQQLQNNPPR